MPYGPYMLDNTFCGEGSHLIRIRDNAEVNCMNNAVLMCNGSEGDSATGTVDIVSGTLAMRCPFTSPGTLADFPTFLLFNGGLLKFTELNGDIVNPHGDAHHVYVGTGPARILVDTSLTDRTVRFDTPFKANPANDGIDGGIEKDGAGTLKLNAPAEIYGPVKVKAGILASGGTDGATPAFGSGSLYLGTFARCTFLY